MNLPWRKRPAKRQLPVTMEEFTDALRAVRIAETNLNHAEGDFVEVAALELTAAEKRFNCLLKIARAGAAKL